MSKGKSTWKYNKLLSGRRNYFDGLSGSSWINQGVDIVNSVVNKKRNDGNTIINTLYNPIDVSKVGLTNLPGQLASQNQKSKANFFESNEGKAVINAGINMGGSLAGGLISDGYSTTAGNVMDGLSNVASAIPGPWGAVASAALKVGAGLTNRAFGVKWNKENIANVENNIRDLKNFQSNAGDWDTLASNWSNAATGMDFNDSYIGKAGWFSGGKVRDKANDLRDQVASGENWVQNTLMNNATSISKQQMNNMLANYGAYGGELHSQGGNFTNGIISINNGDSHENNPNEGVQIGVDPQGIPNLVEEGENIFNNYVYSKRINVPKAVRNKYKLRGAKNISFADASKKLSKESEERPNDPISKNGLESIMYDLAEAQEGVKAKKQAAITPVNYAAHGGNLFTEGGFGGGRTGGGGASGSYITYRDALNGLISLFNPDAPGLRGNTTLDLPSVYGVYKEYKEDLRRKLAAEDRARYAQDPFWELTNALPEYYETFRDRAFNQYGPVIPKWVKPEDYVEITNNASASYPNNDYAMEIGYLPSPTAPTQNTAPTYNLGDYINMRYPAGYTFPSYSGKRYNWFSVDPASTGATYDDGYSTTSNSNSNRTRVTVSGTTRRPSTVQTTPDKQEEPWKYEHMLINEDGSVTPMPESDGYTPGVNFQTGQSWADGPGKKYTMQNMGRYAEDPETHTRRYFYKLKEAPKEEAPAVDNYYMYNPATGNYDIVEGDNPFNKVMNAGYEQVRSAGNKTGGKDFYYKAPEIHGGVKSLPTGSRYAPIVGLAGSVITDALGVTNKPDYSDADAVLNAARLAGQYQPIRHTPIGSYLTYKPFDRDYYLNNMDATQNTAVRNIMNTSGGNRAAAQAGIMALTNNYLDKTGELARQAEEYNLAQKEKVYAYNRDTDKFNVANALSAAEANQKALAAANSAYFSGAASAAEMRQKERLAADAAKSANLSGLFTSLGDVGRENMAWNWRNFGLNTETWGNAGTNPYANLLGNVKVAETNNAAKGGKIKRKKKGLTI